MKEFLKNHGRKIFMALLLGPTLVLAQSTNPTSQQELKNPYLPQQDKAIYSPVRNILDSNLPNTTVNDLFQQYGDALSGYVQVKTQQWENDRISCSSDVNDFLYAYIKQGRGDTPPGVWSKLLQPNFFQSRNGAWNDYDGDGKINGLFQGGGTSVVQSNPKGVDSDPNDGIVLKGNYDDWYGFGVPNAYNPLVKYVKDNFPNQYPDGFMSISQLMFQLGLSLDDDNDNDGLMNNDPKEMVSTAGCSTANMNDCLPYMFYAAYNDADLNHNSTGAYDIFNRIVYDENLVPQMNITPNKDNPNMNTGNVNPFADSSLYPTDPNNQWGYEDKLFNINNPPNPGGSPNDVLPTGPIIQYTYDADVSLRQIRTFTDQAAFNSEEMKKIMVDNCVRMADLQGIMGRMEFQTLIADRIARDISSEKLQNLNDSTFAYAYGIDDSNSDPSKNDPLIVANLGDTVNKARQNEAKKFNDELPDSEVKTALTINQSGSLQGIMNSTLSDDEAAALADNQDDQNTNNTAGQSNPNIATRISSYLLSAVVGPGQNTTNNTNQQNNNESYWQGLLKKTGLGPLNPYASYMFSKDELALRQDAAEQNAREEALAGGGFLPKKDCLKKTSDGTGCADSVNIFSGSTIMNSVNSAVKSVYDWLSGSHSTSDLTPQQ